MVHRRNSSDDNVWNGQVFRFHISIGTPMATQTSSETPRVLVEPANVEVPMTVVPQTTNKESEPATRMRPRSDMDEVLGLTRRLQ